jgi:uncharacterized protein YegL
MIGLDTKTVAASGRSLRLDDGFFFGHDLRQRDSIVYVLDLSGSMTDRTGSLLEQVGTSAGAEAGGALVGGVAGNDVGDAATAAAMSMDKKVELVKDHLNASIRGLPSGAEFNVILFSNGVQRLSPVMITANTGTKLLVSNFVARLREGGSTNMKAAIETGLDTEAKEVMVLTDGLPTDSTPEDILDMVESRNADDQRRVSTVGVGADQAKDFLKKLAEDNGGEYVSYD